MMQTLSLFDGADAHDGRKGHGRPGFVGSHARRTDPVTSREAAALAEPQAGSHKALLLDAVRRFPGRTSAELAALVDLERHEGARRLADLERDGLVVKGPRRRCRVRGTMMMTWREA